MTTQHPTRVPPVDLESLSERQQHVRAKLGPYGEGEVSLMMRTFLNYPEFTRSIGRIGTRVTLTSDLGPRLSRLACLRAAWLTRSEYLWAHLREAALAEGLGKEEIAAVVDGGAGTALTSIERHVVEGVDELHLTYYLSEEKWYRIGRLGPTAVMDLVTTYGFVATLAVALATMGVALEEGLEGWGEARPDDAPPVRDIPSSRELPKRVFEADYALLSPRQVEQTQRMGRRGKPTTSKLQRAMINYPDFLGAISAFGKRAIDDTCLPARTWQLACMRTVWLCDSEYLWSQHRKAILALGVTDADLAGVAEGPDSPALRGFDRVVVRAVDEMYVDHRLSDETWAELEQLGQEGVTDLVLVHGLYILQACVARCFGTTLEEGAVGYLPEIEPLRSRRPEGRTDG